MAVVIMKNGGSRYGTPIYKGNTKGTDSFSQSIATSYTAKKGDVVFAWSTSVHHASVVPFFKNNVSTSLTKVNRISGGVQSYHDVFIADEGDTFRFDNQTTTTHMSGNGCGIVVMPIK